MAIAAPSSSTNEVQIQTLLFDLDGTLAHLRPWRLELSMLGKALWLFWPKVMPWRTRGALWRAVKVMQTHQSARTNFQTLVEELSRNIGFSEEEVELRLRRFFAQSFPTLASNFSPIPGALETLRLAKSLGYRIILATNPVWPEAAVHVRLKAAGLGEVVFDFVSHSEIMGRCKPQLAYFTQLLERLGVSPEQCMMIGNDLRKDIPAKDLGIRTFLVNHPPVQDPRVDDQGSLEDLQTWLKMQGKRG